jgi:8-oxo-dGTP pyrophosphatase MutT (NUDIX family)
MPENPAESLNVYDPGGRVVGSRPREDAGRHGLAVGAVNVLLVNAHGRVLLQKRRADKDNGGLWDKSVGGHVDAGEDFDHAAVREAGEELFGDADTPRVHLAADGPALDRLVASGVLAESVAFRRVALHLNLRDVRHAREGGLRNVVFHVAVYLGRTDVARDGFRPDPGEIDDLRFVSPGEVDALLVGAELAPNMAFLWLIHAHELLARVAPEAGTGRLR